MKKPSKSRLGKLQWKKLSEDTRKLKPNCEYCNATATQVHHLISKFMYKSIFRFDEHNLLSCCGKCHFLFHKNPLITMEWLKNTRKDDYNYLLGMIKENNLK